MNDATPSAGGFDWVAALWGALVVAGVQGVAALLRWAVGRRVAAADEAEREARESTKRQLADLLRRVSELERDVAQSAADVVTLQHSLKELLESLRANTLQLHQLELQLARSMSGGHP